MTIPDYKRRHYKMTDAHKAALAAGRERMKKERADRKIVAAADEADKKEKLKPPPAHPSEAIEDHRKDDPDDPAVATPEGRSQAEEAVWLILTNPRYDAMPVVDKARLAGVSLRTFIRLKTPDLIAHALYARRANYGEHLIAIDAAILEKAKSGDIEAAKIAYERIEGWRPRTVDPLTTREADESEILGALGADVRRDVALRIARDLKLRGRRLPSGAEAALVDVGAEPGVCDPRQRPDANVGQGRPAESLQEPARRQGVPQIGAALDEDSQ
jgi:hypothetical protein